LYNLVTKKIVISRDVIFDEEQIWSWTNEVFEKQILADVDDETEENQLEDESEQPAIIPEAPTVAEFDSPASSRPQRTRRRPAWMGDNEVPDLHEPDDRDAYFVLFSGCDPLKFEEAVVDEKWQQAMKEEIDAIERNHTWQLVDCPQGKIPIGLKWVFKTKYHADGSLERHKARLVAKGYA